MLNPTITEQVRKLSPSERIDLIEFAVSLVKEDTVVQKKKLPQSQENVSDVLLSIAEMVDNIPESEVEKLPTDFATNHDYYLYQAPKK
ncbi:MAG: hypothetical protein HY960_01820 [Ignavibacteriae bacterium]|nr:hypothetical protein [Ignavibacteriota bacterium]